MRRLDGPDGLAVVVLVCALVLAACASDGRTMATPTKPVPSTTLVPTASTIAGGGPKIGSAATRLTLQSPAFVEGGAIPAVLTCDGANQSPPLTWDGVISAAPDAVELAITVVDPDAGGFVHWAVAGLSPTLVALSQGALPEGAVEATNSTGGIGWTGPCPPKGPAHHYAVTLYALDAPSGVVAGANGTDVVALLTKAAAARVTLTATYARA